MSRTRAKRALWLIGGLLVGGLPAVAPAQGPRVELAMLDRIADGRWELKIRGSQARPERLCIHTGREFIQLRHQEIPCGRTVVEDTGDSVTVQYTCKGRGYGRTRIRRETDRLIQLEAQGIADGIPYDFVAEGRRVGDCGS